MTEIVRTKTQGGSNIFEWRDVMVTGVDAMREGISQKTGTPWKIRNVNVKIDQGDGNYADYMRVTFRNSDAEKAGKFEINNTRLNVKLDFNIQGGKFQSNEIRVVEFDVIN